MLSLEWSQTRHILGWRVLRSSCPQVSLYLQMGKEDTGITHPFSGSQGIILCLQTLLPLTLLLGFASVFFDFSKCSSVIG